MLAEPKEKKDAISKSLKTKTNLNSLLIHLGKIQKAHGIKGEVLLSFSSGEPLKPLPPILYFCQKLFEKPPSKKNPEFQPYEVLKSRFIPQGCLLQLKNCENRDTALQLQGTFVYVENTELQSPTDNSIFLSEILGFKVYVQKTHSSTKKEIGLISHFLSHSHQDLIVVSQNGNLIEIPFIQDYICDINFENKTLSLILPENFPNIP